MGFQLIDVTFKNILEIPELILPEKQIICIVGESGSGKTTLLKLLNNLISPDSGVIKYNSQDLEDWDPVQLRREVLMLPQNPVVFPGTIRENLQIGLEFAGLEPATDDRLLEAMCTAKLTKPLETDAEELSGGEKQRLALARILLLNPRVLLLDEPSSALDDETEELLIQNVVGFARKTSRMLIMVTHSKAVAANHGDTVVTIANGRVFSIQEARHE